MSTVLELSKSDSSRSNPVLSLFWVLDNLCLRSREFSLILSWVGLVAPGLLKSGTTTGNLQDLSYRPTLYLSGTFYFVSLGLGLDVGPDTMTVPVPCMVSVQVDEEDVDHSRLCLRSETSTFLFSCKIHHLSVKTGSRLYNIQNKNKNEMNLLTFYIEKIKTMKILHK